MASRNLQPSELEIQREVEALRDIRRRSTTPGALIIDPDLPNQSPPSSPTATYWSGGSTTSSSLNVDSDTSSSSHEGSSSSDRIGRSPSSRMSDGSSNPTDDPFHLFWVPAGLHPEIAPAEFRAFLKEHARAPPSEGSELVRSDSASSGLGRKRSMLSRQYRPSENDGVEEENVIPLRRNRSSLYANTGPQLTISDLQKLGELAEESEDPSKLRNVLRRSLSLNLSPSAIDKMEDIPEIGDEADAPIVVPPPGQILRRSARTKIRKPGLPGDGNGHRFGSTRRGMVGRPHTANLEPRTSSDFSSSDHGEVESNAYPQRRQTLSDEGYSGNQRPDSYSEETLIYESYSYSRDDDDEVVAPDVEPLVPSVESDPTVLPPALEIQPALLEALGPVLHQPQPQKTLVPQTISEYQQPSRSPSPPEPTLQFTPIEPPSIISPASSIPIPPIPSSPTQQRKEKDKKGLFGKWGGDKGSKKGGKDKERESQRAHAEKESGFFGSLFGKKKQDSDFSTPLGQGVNAGREAAQALLGASKSSKSYVPPTSPGLAPGGGPNSYARYPIHVERAIYRLSHIKLANPRRPLYEQVLISNLMFWYLGVINKAQNPTPATTQAGPNGNVITAGNTPPNASEKGDREREQAEKEQKEREQREKAEKEIMEREIMEREQREREMVEMKKKESGRRGSLTKTPTGGVPSGGRRAEMPIKGPQYEMQHRVMEQEYGGFNNQQGMNMGRPPLSPGSMNSASHQQQQYQRMQQQPLYGHGPPKIMQAQSQPQVPDDLYYGPDGHHMQQQRLPPGAMAPSEQSVWMPQSSPKTRNHSVSPPPSPTSGRHSRSPPPQSHMQQQHQQQPMSLYSLNNSSENLIGGPVHRTPGRSLSATVLPASPYPQANGALRKGQSAHAVPSQQGRRPRTSEGSPVINGTGEEEDVPLAVWQQQRRR